MPDGFTYHALASMQEMKGHGWWAWLASLDIGACSVQG